MRVADTSHWATPCAAISSCIYISLTICSSLTSYITKTLKLSNYEGQCQLGLHDKTPGRLIMTVMDRVVASFLVKIREI